MCLITLAWNPTPQLRLLVVANRDEFHARPSAPLAAWAERPDLIAGRDIEAQGTWLGLSTKGRLAAVTNVRLPGLMRTGLRSRGELPQSFLAGSTTPDEHLSALQPQFAEYGPCNLLLADAQQACYASNRPGVPMQRLQDGIYGLSNAALDTPWPKTTQLKAVVSNWIAAGEMNDLNPLFAALADDRTPPDEVLPDTGVGLVRERLVAPAFIRGHVYGTRCSTVVRVDAAGEGLIIERRFGPNGVASGESVVEFRWPTKGL